jgi:predicted nucleic acid-binding protein
MEKNEASAEFVAEMVSKLAVAFYETPESLFEALAKTILYLQATEDDVRKMVNEAILAIRRTRITIADVVGAYSEEKKSLIHN